MSYCVARSAYHGFKSAIDASIVDCPFGTGGGELRRDVDCPLAFTTVDGWLRSMDVALLALSCLVTDMRVDIGAGANRSLRH